MTQWARSKVQWSKCYSTAHTDRTKNSNLFLPHLDILIFWLKPAEIPRQHHTPYRPAYTGRGLTSKANLLSNHKVQLLEQNKVHIVNNNRGDISTSERQTERETGRKGNLKRETEHKEENHNFDRLLFLWKCSGIISLSSAVKPDSVTDTLTLTHAVRILKIKL